MGRTGIINRLNAERREMEGVEMERQCRRVNGHTTDQTSEEAKEGKYLDVNQLLALDQFKTRTGVPVRPERSSVAANIADAMLDFRALAFK